MDMIQIQPDGSIKKTGPKIFVVTQKSATSTGVTTPDKEVNVPLNEGHSALVKYESRSQEAYTIIKGHLRKLVKDARAKVKHSSMENST